MKITENQIINEQIDISSAYNIYIVYTYIYIFVYDYILFIEYRKLRNYP